MYKVFAFLSLLNLFSLSAITAAANMVNVYSFRQAELIKPLTIEFTKQTGIKVNIVSGKADKLMKRLIEDGNNSFADVLLTVDVARLDRAKKLNLIEPITSSILHDNIPQQLRDPENFWFGLSLRTRAVFYAKDKVNPQLITRYSDLLDKQWLGRICARKGSHFYNRSMVASFIYHYGARWAKNWVKGFTHNLAMRPNGGDRDQLRKVARGECDIAIANSYYYGMLSASEKQSDRSAYQKVGILFPENNGIGSHVNISGAAITSSAKNKVCAVKFIEFLTTQKAQKIYADINYEYPIRTDMRAGALLDSWGNLIADTKSIHQLPLFHQQAKQIIAETNW
jgi:iron(III) transport system substrate-binding protein